MGRELHLPRQNVGEAAAMGRKEGRQFSRTFAHRNTLQQLRLKARTERGGRGVKGECYEGYALWPQEEEDCDCGIVTLMEKG